MKPEKTHLTIHNKGGSVEHYYHFLLGFLLPLINYRYFLRADLGEVLVRSCGIMDKLIEEMAIPGVAIADRNRHSKLAQDDSPGYTYETVDGFDSPLHNHARELHRCRTKILLRFHLYTQTKTHRKGSTPKVLMINRMPSDSFYHTEQCEIKTSGNDRRSIPNFNELVSAMSDLSPTVIALEGLSLKQQVGLFGEHDLIIAQHGASLANLVFCQRKTCVIEICPREKIHEFHVNGDIFADLASHMNLNFFRIEQGDSHASVDPDLLTKPVQDALIKIGM